LKDISDNIEIKNDYINLILSISFAIITYLLLAKFISLFYKPDISLVLERARIILGSNLIKECNPEPLEKTLFIAGIIFIPVFIFVYYSIFRRLLNNNEEKLIDNIWIFICLYMVTILPVFIFKVLDAPSLYVPPYSHLQLYILNSVLDRNFSPIYFILFFIMFYVFLKINYSSQNNLVRFITILLDIFCLLLIAYMGTIYVFSIFTDNIHFEAVFYSVVQLFKGIPLGVDGFTNTYGLYPYFLNIIFKIIGLSVLKCSIVFCILIAFSYLLIWVFLKNTVKNKFLVFLGFTSVVYLPNLSEQLSSIELYKRVQPYYQYLPLRYLFPCLLLFLSSLYIKHKNKYFYILCSIICSLSLLWNIDTGIVTAVSWILLNFYSEFEQNNLSTTFKNTLWHITKISAIMIIVFSLFYLYVFIWYGRIVDLSALLQTFSVFSGLGYLMLPMPLIHPWNILALTYTIGIGISIRALIKKNITPWTKIIFLVTIMGTGMLLYYQGRSHDNTFFGPSFYFFVLLTLFLDKILSFLENNSNILLSYLSVMIALILSLSVIFMSINIKKEFSIIETSIKNVRARSPEKDIVEVNCNFIRKHTNPSEKIIIFSGISGIYFSKIPNISAFNPDINELFLKSDHVRLEKVIADSDVKIFLESGGALNGIRDILRTLKVADDNGYMLLLKKIDKKGDIPFISS